MLKELMEYMTDNGFTLTGPPPDNYICPCYEYVTSVEDFSGKMVPFDEMQQITMPTEILEKSIIMGNVFRISIQRRPVGGMIGGL